ncbi:SMI1/KNR4 family protein [Laceyella putida]|uniref:SMI1/KNR4 family protein n=1 Tax=Laceyella putida TaxID=110101 RepID=A0ABW2RPZ4_9BACL
MQKKEGLPEGYVVILMEEDDYCYCLDTFNMVNGECPVVLWFRLDLSLQDRYDHFYSFMLNKILESDEDEEDF